MSIEHVLEAGRKSVEGCSVAAFGDTAARLILRASHSDGVRREYLDALCDQAASCFDLLDTSWDSSMGTPDGHAVLNEAAILTKGETIVFVRADRSRSEFLCFVFENPEDAPDMFAAARQTIQKITAIQ